MNTKIWFIIYLIISIIITIIASIYTIWLRKNKKINDFQIIIFFMYIIFGIIIPTTFLLLHLL